MTLYIRNREELELMILTMHGEGWSIRGLTRHFKISRNTVRKILRKNEMERDRGHSALPAPRIPRMSKLDPHISLVKKLMEGYPDITGQRLFEELRDDGFTGGITIVRERLARLRPQPKKAPVVRFETEPGHQGQMDWSPYTLNFTRTGKSEVLCFSYILGFSRRQYIDFTTDRKFFTLIRRHQDAFEYFGGVPSCCLYDGEKTILLRWEAGRPVYNPAFIAFSTHYRCSPVGCRPGRAQTKGKVERPFQYVEGNLLNARTFEDLEDLRNRGRWWMANRSDLHKHDTTGRPPIELFMEKEKGALQPLPAHPYDTSEVLLRVCRCDGLIEFEANQYSVPLEYVADILAIKATEHEVTIYSPELDMLACHERQPRGMGRVLENPEHRNSSKVRYGLEPVKEAFLSLGDATDPFLAGLKDKHPRNCGFHARAILSMKERYHADDINRALAHAVSYYAFDGKAIERILAARAKPRTLESLRNDKAGQRLSESLPEITQRPLDEYTDMISQSREQEKESEEKK